MGCGGGVDGWGHNALLVKFEQSLWWKWLRTTGAAVKNSWSIVLSQFFFFWKMRIISKWNKNFNFFWNQRMEKKPMRWIRGGDCNYLCFPAVSNFALLRKNYFLNYKTKLYFKTILFKLYHKLYFFEIYQVICLLEREREDPNGIMNYFCLFSDKYLHSIMEWIGQKRQGMGLRINSIMERNWFGQYKMPLS